MANPCAVAGNATTCCGAASELGNCWRVVLQRSCVVCGFFAQKHGSRGDPTRLLQPGPEIALHCGAWCALTAAHMRAGHALIGDIIDTIDGGWVAGSQRKLALTFCELHLHNTQSSVRYHHHQQQQPNHLPAPHPPNVYLLKRIAMYYGTADCFQIPP